MPQVYYLTLDCETCDQTMRKSVIDLSAIVGDQLEIDLDLAAGQQTFTCDRCGGVSYTGDLDVMHEPGEYTDDDDDQGEV